MPEILRFGWWCLLRGRNKALNPVHSCHVTILTPVCLPSAQLTTSPFHGNNLIHTVAPDCNTPDNHIIPSHNNTTPYATETPIHCHTPINQKQRIAIEPSCPQPLFPSPNFVCRIGFDIWVSLPWAVLPQRLTSHSRYIPYNYEPIHLLVQITTKILKKTHVLVS